MKKMDYVVVYDFDGINIEYLTLPMSLEGALQRKAELIVDVDDIEYCGTNLHSDKDRFHIIKLLDTSQLIESELNMV